ncbi:MAG: hypothetical protein RLZZ187_2602 [Pseudomonadota bacterium]|jgi:hypothetical protein
MSGTRDNSGALFKNTRKEKDTHADYRGTITVEGREFWLDAWLNKDKNGQTYMGLKVKPKEAPADAPAHRDVRPSPKPALDDGSDIPF